MHACICLWVYTSSPTLLHRKFILLYDIHVCILTRIYPVIFAKGRMNALWVSFIILMHKRTCARTHTHTNTHTDIQTYTHRHTHTQKHTYTSTQAQHANFISLLFYFWNSRVAANGSYRVLTCASDWLPNKISHCGLSVDVKVSEVKTECARQPCAFTSRKTFPFNFNCFWW